MAAGALTMAGVCSPSRWEPKCSCRPGVLCEASLVWVSDEGPTSTSPKAVATCAHHTPGPAHLPGFHCPEGHCLNHHSTVVTCKHSQCRNPTRSPTCPEPGPSGSRLTGALKEVAEIGLGTLFLLLWSDVGHGSDRRKGGNEIPGPGSVLSLGDALLGPV